MEYYLDSPPMLVLRKAPASQLADIKGGKRTWRICASNQFTYDFAPFKLYYLKLKL